MWHPILLCSPCLALGTPKNAGVTWQFRPLLRPREGTGEAANLDFLYMLGVGHPRECRSYVAILPYSGPAKAGVR